MRYYNEVKAERAIRRKAGWITFLIFAFTISLLVVIFSEGAQELLIDPVKEWLDSPQEQMTPKERA